jgi:hypothetical protein
MLPFLLQAEEMKTVPTGARRAMRNRAERGIMLALVLKAACQNGNSEDLPLIESLKHGISGWQSRIAILRFSIALDLAPEAVRCAQSQIETVGEFRSTPACPLAQISFDLGLQAPGDPPKQMRSMVSLRSLLQADVGAVAGEVE